MPIFQLGIYYVSIFRILATVYIPVYIILYNLVHEKTAEKLSRMSVAERLKMHVLLKNFN